MPGALTLLPQNLLRGTGVRPTWLAGEIDEGALARSNTRLDRGSTGLQVRSIMRTMNDKLCDWWGIDVQMKCDVCVWLCVVVCVRGAGPTKGVYGIRFD